MSENTQYFSPEARKRLAGIFPEDGTQRYDKLMKFISIVVKHKGLSLLVPPELDQDLHEILAARDEEGKGFERVKLKHIAKFSQDGTEESVGKKMTELSSETAQETLKILKTEGFEIVIEKTYDQPACTLTCLN